MIKKDFDITNPNIDVPAVSDVLYRLYHYQALDFEINSIKKIIEFLPQLYPNISSFEKIKMVQLLNLQIIIKFCHYAENLGAFSLSFLTTYKELKDEIIGSIKKIYSYNIGHINDFYANINNRDVSYVAKILGYPPIKLQTKDEAGLFKLSSHNTREFFYEIGQMYSELAELYNAYKHGYRVVSGHKNNSVDIYTYINHEGKGKFIETDLKTFNHLNNLVRKCYIIFDSMFKNHYARMNHEKNNSIETDITFQIIYKKEDNVIKNQNFKYNIPNRAKKLKEEILEYDKVYETFKNKLKENDNGKIIAIDIDNRFIISKNFDLNKVIEEVNRYEKSGRKYLRRVGKNKNIGVIIY